MGPVLLLDKSALELLSVDESTWLDVFFFGNIPPPLYLETLADLTKERKGRYNPVTPEKLVSEIAFKTPTSYVGPNIHHRTLVEQDLLGNHIKMDTRPIVHAGVPKRAPDGRIGMHLDKFPETEALQRWQQEQFSELERDFASNWRADLLSTDHEQAVNLVKNITPAGKKLKNLDEIKVFVDEFIEKCGSEALYLMAKLFGFTDKAYHFLTQRYQSVKPKNLKEFAPYAAYVLKVDLFFYLSIYFGHISGDRASNKIDISYLYYLPFCMGFVSQDKLHARTVPLFCEQGQMFIKGSDMKVACKEVDDYYMQFKDEIEDKGLLGFVGYPPGHMNNAITRLWDEFCLPDWRTSGDPSKPSGTHKEPTETKDTKDVVRNYNDAIPIDGMPDEEDMQFIYTQSMVKAKRGKWRIISKDFESKIKEDNNK